MNKFKVTLIAIISMMGISANAQDKVQGSVGADVVSRYIWRGQALTDAAVQPSAGISYKGFSLSAWGSIGFLHTDEAKEFDLTLAYQYKNFNIGITDYYFSNRGEANKYFEYRNGLSSHVWEANIGYDFGPVALQWYTNFAGADGVNASGNRAYSSYVELSAPFSLVTCDWLAKVGAVPYATDFYKDANGFAVTNISLRVTKAIPVCKKWDIPVFAEGICNPSTKKGYLVVGFTLEP